jgi:hypothetical protein
MWCVIRIKGGELAVTWTTETLDRRVVVGPFKTKTEAIKAARDYEERSESLLMIAIILIVTITVALVNFTGQ